MKTKLIRFFFLGIIMCSLSLQAFTPPLPPGTTVDTNYQENYLYFIDIDYDQLVIPPPE
jgi:hypothetical protein